MNIQQMVRRSSLALIGLIVVSIIFSAYGICKISFGGEMHRVNQQLNDFNADILPPPEYLVEPYLVANLLARSPQQVDDHARKLNELKRQWRERAGYWAASDLDPVLKAGIGATVTQDGIVFWQIVENHLLPAVKQGKINETNQALARLDNVYDRHRRQIDELVGGAAARQKILAEDATLTLATTGAGLALCVLLIFASIAGLLILVQRKVISPLATTASTMERMAAGDIEAGRQTTHSADEIGIMTRAIEVFRQSAINAREEDAERKRIVRILSEKLSAMAHGDLEQPIESFFAEAYKGIRMDFNQAQAKLREVIHSVVQSAHAIQRSTAEVNQAALDLSQRAARQAATLEETAAALQRTNKDIQSSSALAQETHAEVARARENATQNREIVESAMGAMGEIESAFAEVASITKLIQDIAFQTNILALNAGVEATRAGEAGKGFIVVASEVRALAQRSSEAVSAIQQLIAKSGEKIAIGSNQVTSSGDALREMIVVAP